MHLNKFCIQACFQACFHVIAVAITQIFQFIKQSTVFTRVHHACMYNAHPILYMKKWRF